MPRSSPSPAAVSPRRAWPLALLLVGGAACSSPNPAFGADDSSGGGGTIDADTVTATSPTATSPTATTDGTTGDPATSGLATTDTSMSTDPDPQTGSTTAGSNVCCDDDECDPQVLQCVCDLMPACCNGEWGEFCPDIAIACGGTCDGEDASCCAPRPDRPACEGVALVPAFCLLHATCCLTEWTSRCVAEYDIATQGCGLGDCGFAQAVPGCSDPDIMECVCERRPQCCAEEWGAACVEAGTKC